VAFLTDITERSASKPRSVRAKALPQPGGTITDVITEVDAKGTFLFASPVLHLERVRPAALRIRRPSISLTPQIPSAAGGSSKKAKEKEGIEGLEYTVKTKDGEISDHGNETLPPTSMHEGYLQATVGHPRHHASETGSKRRFAAVSDATANILVESNRRVHRRDR